MKLRSILRRRLRLQHPLTPILYLPPRRTRLTFAVMIGVLSATAALGQDTAASTAVPAKVQVVLNTLWVIFAGVLVFFMNAGFCMLETGFCRAKNAVNLLSKNLIVFALSSIAYWAIGFALMFGDGNGVVGSSGFFLLGADNSPATAEAYRGVYSSLSWAAVPLFAKFFFQVVFAGTAATIVSGAVAERIKFYAFFIFSLLLVGISYPITGHWIWGGGWLQQLGMWDFAGSTVVHSVGGWAALMGAALLGPRLGRFLPDGSVAAIPGHNFAIATLGCLILWLGWFGFNPGSTMTADPEAIAHIVVTTNMAAAFGGVTATVVSTLYFGKPDLSMIINGILAGLVAITAPCAFVTIESAALIGSIAGIIIIFSVVTLDRLKIDDPVGAISVHLVNGIWGTIAVGLFADGPGRFYEAGAGPLKGLLWSGDFTQLGHQLVGVLAVGGFTVAFSTAVWLLLNLTIGIRVSPEEEIEGLDIGEHGMEAYAGFLLREEVKGFVDLLKRMSGSGRS
ncbi:MULTISPECIES: ammonium transporter [unclassified Thermosynechococcus]|uniref:ammonium transporter n=1 Tax=unclassified Thermosynechococcus TaxID=2622553 RepID=UPI0019ECCE3C|nr:MULTISPECIES: ammonium transporter [unclassified Thermosynechococcus]HIK23319.1 ammonium transporter [Thermosynechococcus sp. M3746_W2019_013]